MSYTLVQFQFGHLDSQSTHRSIINRGLARSVGRALLARFVMIGGLLVCVLQTGCVHRRLTIHSDPPGALVLMDGEEIGYTPVAADFTYYATREITLIKPGYERLTTLQRVKTPWYQIPPMDFFSDNLLPVRVADRHEFTYQLQQQLVVPTDELQDRAEQLRNESRFGGP